MNEMSWIEEHFYNQALSKGITIGEERGEARGEKRAINAAIDFMRSSGMTNEQIESFRSSFSKS